MALLLLISKDLTINYANHFVNDFTVDDVSVFDQRIQHWYVACYVDGRYLGRHKIPTADTLTPLGYPISGVWLVYSLEDLGFCRVSGSCQ